MKKTLMLLAALALAACGAQPPAPKTPAQALAATEATITAGYKTVNDLELSKSLTRDQAQRLLGVLDKARAELTTAKALPLVNGIPQDTTQQLILINSLLLQYQQALQADQGGVK